MAIFSGVSYRVSPGRDEDFLAMAREAKSIIEPLGVNLRGIRLRRAAIAGPNSGIYRVSFEYDDLASWAETVAREEQDPRYLEFVKQSATSGIATNLGRSLFAQIAPGAGPGGHGSVVEVNIGRLKPGRMGDLQTLIGRVNEIVPSYGVLNLRHFMMTVGGPDTGLVLAIAEFADVRAFADAQQRDQEPEWRDILSSIVGPDGPIIPVASSMLIDIPL